MTETTNEPEMGKGLTRVGVAASALWLVMALSYVVINRAKVLALEPNEVGDFLAGCFAPLAFFWLVLGFFQQGSELRNSGRALWLQGEELRNSVEQQRQLVEVTREQLQFESQRISAHLQRQRQLAQPRLSLELGSSGGSYDGHLQNFDLVNYGRPCTQIEIGFTALGKNLKQYQLNTGERLPFQLTFNIGDGPIVATVGYLDQQMEPGAARFEILFEGGKVSIAEFADSVLDGPTAAV